MESFVIVKWLLPKLQFFSYTQK